MKNQGTPASPLRRGLFADKHVVITGAGRGIGAALADYLLADGALISAHLGRAGGEAHWSFPRESDQGNSRLCSHTADFTQHESVKQMAEAIKQMGRPIDILIHNAGTMMGRVPLTDMDGEHLHKVWALNCESVVTLTQALLPLLVQAGQASIVNVSSISADTGGSPGSSAYSAAKGFISTWTRSMATELAPQGIRVNAISPGTIDTDFHQRYSSAEKLRKTAESTPLKRLGTAQDCVMACLFLAEPTLSGFITGQIIGINGGTRY